MTDDRVKWLVIAYEVSSCKRTCFDHIYRYVGSISSSQSKIQVPVQVSSYESKSKICTEVGINSQSAYSPTQTHLEMHLRKETQNEINSAGTRITKFSRNDPYLKQWVTNDKYDNIIFHVHNHNQEYDPDNPTACNCTTNTSTMYSHL